MVKHVDRYAVLGNPVQHSLSPFVHQQFAKQVDHHISYEKILVSPDKFAQTVDEFFLHQQGKGANITLPFKQEAWHLVAKHSQRASIAGAVNTLCIDKHDQLVGDNTDGIGLIRDIENNNHVTLQNRHLLILGAGGAARGALMPLLAAQPRSLRIANRTKHKAVLLAQELSQYGNISSCGLDELGSQGSEPFDIIINTTSASLRAELPRLPAKLINADTYCYDMMFQAHATPFLFWATKHGVTHCHDGIGMLVEQAAESFFLWRKVMPKTGPVIRALKKEIGHFSL